MRTENGAENHGRGDHGSDVGQKEQDPEKTLAAPAIEEYTGQHHGHGQLHGDGAQSIKKSDFKAIVKPPVAAFQHARQTQGHQPQSHRAEQRINDH